MRHLDLFSGIGGFALAADHVWPGIEHVFVEKDAFCQTILRKHWPHALIYGDIKELARKLENGTIATCNGNAHNAKNVRKQKEDHTANHATLSELESGERRIEHDIAHQDVNGRNERSMKSTKDMVVSVSVAEKQKKRFSRLTTKMEEGMQSDAITTHRHGSSSSGMDTQTTIKSSALTATTPNTTKEYALTGKIDILTGGFPCQPFSVAGRRRGTADDRYLWEPMFTVIERTFPTWVIAENVRGLVTWNDGMVLEKCCTDLESIGYEVQPVVVPACAVGAPHRRDRVWIIGHAKYDGFNGSQDRKGGEAGKRSDTERENELCEPAGSVMAWEAATDTERKGKGRRGELKAKRQCGKRGGAERGEGYDWSEDWPSVAARLCRLDDELPSGLPRPRGWRNAALKAYGNAIVPQVAIKIMEAIKTADKKAPQPEGVDG